MNQPYRILLVDDHRNAREGMRAILETDPIFTIVAEGRNGTEAIRLTDEFKPDLVLMDIHMPEMDGFEATRSIKALYPWIKIVMVTVSDDINHLFKALRSGAQGYLLKNLHPEEWPTYLKAIAHGESPLNRELALMILREFSFKKNKQGMEPTRLSDQEKEILSLNAIGLTIEGITSKINIPEDTVKTHTRNIMQKIQW